MTRRGVLHIRVSKLSDPRYELLIALHELVEVTLCKHRSVTEKSVDAFDIAFEKRRKLGNDDEPGDDPRAPYRREHFFATSVERLMAAELGVDWRKYEAEINALP